MNDLEPWKIWSVTGALVCLILGSMVARVHPLRIGEVQAGAATLSSTQLAKSDSAPDSESAFNQNDAYGSYSSYSSFYPHTSYRGAGYSSAWSSAAAPISRQLNGSGYSQNIAYQNIQEAALNVTRQLYDDANYKSDMIVGSSEQSNSSVELADIISANYPAGDEMVYLGSSGSLDEPDYDDTSDLAGSPQIAWFGQSGANISGRVNLALGTVVLSTVSGNTVVMQGSLNGVVSNFTVNLTQAISSSTGDIPLDGPVSIDQAVTPDNLDVEDLYDLQTQNAVMAARDEAVAQEQAAQKQTELDFYGEVQPQKSSIVRSKTSASIYFASNLEDD